MPADGLALLVTSPVPDCPSLKILDTPGIQKSKFSALAFPLSFLAWTGKRMAYIAVFVAGMIITIVALSLLAASIRYALDHDGAH
jgi:hypothetical protein